MRISDWSSDVCSSDLQVARGVGAAVDGDVAFLRGCAARGQQRQQQQAGQADGHGDILRATGAKVKCMAGVRGFPAARIHAASCRSEEHTSELQSLMRISYAVFCLKKKNYKHEM